MKNNDWEQELHLYRLDPSPALAATGSASFSGVRYKGYSFRGSLNLYSRSVSAKLYGEYLSGEATTDPSCKISGTAWYNDSDGAEQHITFIEYGTLSCSSETTIPANQGADLLHVCWRAS